MATHPATGEQATTFRFFVRSAIACTLIAFLPFVPTFWWQWPAGTFTGSTLLILHGLLFTAWPLLLWSQARRAAQGRYDRHRAWGLGGIALATALVFFGVAVVIGFIQHGLAAGYGDHTLRFSIVPFSAIALFAAFFTCAIANVRQPEAHQRWMILATIALLQAAVARIFFAAIIGVGPGLRPGVVAPPPAAVDILPGLLLMGFVIAGILHDRRTRGQVHRVWWVGGGVMLAVVLLRVPFSATSFWLGFAHALANIAG